ncbi:hypothetical protein [Candidatus Chromulinivorax destructor]|uniref:Uncharacterized protein n=1 Tax=Candidatus Chromulinivorax destructor TaxID=2066483 RepID=A0A345ZAA3_9BACT|nr:hypothetical protein [Candidatus Chromulinivorax destructor]AXK60220.1 hypothetical protein C0J27_00445 [Candidatus Chromulinivorax destructor]
MKKFMMLLCLISMGDLYAKLKDKRDDVVGKKDDIVEKKDEKVTEVKTDKAADKTQKKEDKKEDKKKILQLKSKQDKMPQLQK